MIVFHHASHRLHDPVELHVFGGKALPPAEVAARADRILSGLAKAEAFQIREPGPVDRAFLAEVHNARYLDFLETAHSRWRAATGGGIAGEASPYIRPLPGTAWKEPKSVLAQLGRFGIDVDPILSGTWEAAVAAASSAFAAAELVDSGEPAVYALTRPPGHHAGPETFGGYCYLNNAAVAAARLARGGRQVAILDLDAHHGNGTQTIFWDRMDVLTLSIHGNPDDHYPFFLGYSDEIGGAGAAGTNRNFPLPTNAGWGAYEEALDAAFRLVSMHRADCLVVPLGVDTHASHGVLGLQWEDYSRIGAALARTGLPVVFVQEGGYEPDTLERAVPAVLTGFLQSLG